MKVLITGGAGFIGSHLVDRWIPDHEVAVYDNFSLGRWEYLATHRHNPRLTVIEADLLDLDRLSHAMRGCDLVMHLAANSDIREGTLQSGLDLTQGTVATHHVLEAMRHCGVKRLVFASTSAVYGLATTIPTPESYGPLLPLSLYGASKLAAEGLISASVHLYGLQTWIVRFANVVGPRMTHGVLCDFLKKLTADPSRLEILGDGTQRKAYLHISDCVDGMLFALAHAQAPINLFNLSGDDTITVQEIANRLVMALGLSGVTFSFTGTPQGWLGDVPRMGLDARALHALGWRPRLTSAGAVDRAIEELLACRLLSSPAA